MDDALNHLAVNDDVLAQLIHSHPRPSLEKHGNYYQELVESIIGQQLSVKAARTIRNRFVELFGGAFPAPEQLLDKDIEELRGVGLSRPKASYIQDLALKVIESEVKFDELNSLSNDEIIAELTKVKGIDV